MDSRAKQLGSLPVRRLIWKMGLPSVAGVMAYNLYSLFDTLFVARGVGMDAVGAVAVSFPLFLALSALSSTLGAGAAALLSRALGEGDRERAARVAANAFVLFYAAALAVTVLGLLFLDPLLYAVGVTETLLPDARAYTRIILLGAVTSTGFSSLIRAQGDSRYAMAIWMIPMAVNVVLDLFFLFVLRLGVAGAAAGTVGGQAVSMGMSIWFFYCSDRCVLRLCPRHFRPDVHLMGEILLSGLPSFAQTAGYSVAVALVNRLLRRSGGDLALGTYGLVSQINTFLLLPLTGLGQGIGPIIGYNAGAGQTARVRETVRTAGCLAAAYGLLACVVLWRYSGTILRLFTGDGAVLALGSAALPVANAGLAFAGVQQVHTTCFQSVGRKGLALLLALSGQVLFLLPAALLLQAAWGLDGIWWAFPVSQLAACGLSAACYGRWSGRRE